jgi:hypothetical protein
VTPLQELEAIVASDLSPGARLLRFDTWKRRWVEQVHADHAIGVAMLARARDPAGYREGRDRYLAASVVQALLKTPGALGLETEITKTFPEESERRRLTLTLIRDEVKPP